MLRVIKDIENYQPFTNGKKTISQQSHDGLWRLPRKKDWFAVIMPFFCCIVSLFLLNCQSDEPLFFPHSNEWSVDSKDEMKVGKEGKSVEKREVSTFAYEYGYAVCVGDESSMVSDAIFTLQRFRSHWKSAYPFMVAHCSELSAQNIAAIKIAHEQSIGEESLSPLLDKDGRKPELHVVDLCIGAVPAKKKRLRSWFCKTSALASSRYRHTMLIDTDLVWLHNPDLLFTAPGYVKTGALFFRDRYITIHPSTVNSFGWALQYASTVELINRQRRTSPSSALGDVISTTDPSLAAQQAKALAYNDGNGMNYFWRFGYTARLNDSLAHNQESSVVILDKQRNHRTVAEIERLIPTFNLGYGDKEIYWVAAIIAGDSYSWEPYLQGLYGDCGPVLHFNPNVDLPSTDKAVSPFFINGQFLVEGVHHIGEGIQEKYTQPVEASPSTILRGCSCEEMGGCVKAAEYIAEAVKLQQAFMLTTTGQPPSKFMNRFRRFIKRVYAKFLPSWLS
jgi:hypothetical protein